MAKVRKEALHQRTAILAGVMPVKSANALNYMAQEVPGMRIQPEYILRMEQAEDPKEEGVKIAVETIQKLRDIEGVSGIHLMPLLWESIMPRLIQESGLSDR